MGLQAAGAHRHTAALQDPRGVRDLLVPHQPRLLVGGQGRYVLRPARGGVQEAGLQGRGILGAPCRLRTLAAVPPELLLLLLLLLLLSPSAPRSPSPSGSAACFFPSGSVRCFSLSMIAAVGPSSLRGGRPGASTRCWNGVRHRGSMALPPACPSSPAFWESSAPPPLPGLREYAVVECVPEGRLTRWRYFYHN